LQSAALARSPFVGRFRDNRRRIVTAEKMVRPGPRRNGWLAPTVRALRLGAVVLPALLIVAGLPSDAAAKYGSPPTINVGSAGHGAIFRSVPRSIRTSHRARPADAGRLRGDAPWRCDDLPLIASRGTRYQSRIGTAVRSPARSLAMRAVLLQRPRREISSRPLVQRAAACRRSAGRSRQLRAPPSLAR
jgi:hypothetical protein